MEKKLGKFLKKYVFAAGECLWAFTLGIFSARGRNLISIICKHRGHDFLPTPIIPKIELKEIIGSSPSLVDVREPVALDGNVSVLEIVVMNKLVRYFDPARVFEIGTFDGRTTLNIAANSSSDTKVLTMDLPKEEMEFSKLMIERGETVYINKLASGLRFKGTECENKIEQLFGDSATFDFSSYHGSIDFAFVDGSHSYEYIKNDTEKVKKLLRNGVGTVIWHDYGVWEGVTRALNEYYEKGGEYRSLRHIEGTSFVILCIDL